MSTQAYQPKPNFLQTRILLTGIVTILIVGLLLWQQFHGGVPSHHILNQDDLPQISNWWGGLLLPMLTWILLFKIENRLRKQAPNSTQEAKNQMIRILWLFFVGLLLGILLVIAFLNDYQPFLDNVLYLFLILSLVVPIYYAEFILGFVLGMTYTFGTMLPTAFILILAGLGFLLYRFIRPLIFRGIKIFSK